MGLGNNFSFSCWICSIAIEVPGPTQVIHEPRSSAASAGTYTFSLLLKICWLLALAGHHFFVEKCSVVFSNPPHQETLKNTTKQKKKQRKK
jgi:hypothetical protein